MTIRKLRSLFILAALVAEYATAGAIATAQDSGAIVTFYTENCTLKEVTNLPSRAVWTENGKEIEGCYTVRPDAGLIVFYFADRTVGIVPLQALRRVRET